MNERKTYQLDDSPNTDDDPAQGQFRSAEFHSDELKKNATTSNGQL